MNKKYRYNYIKYQVSLRKDEGEQLNNILKANSIGFTDFIRKSMNEEIKKNEEETIIEKEEMQQFISDYEEIEKALKVAGKEDKLGILLRIKKRYIDKLES